MKAVIIEDEKSGTEALITLLKEYCPEVEITGTASDIGSGLDLVLQQRPDVLFLDIEVGGKTGFDLLDQLDDFCPEVIFTTAYQQYAIRAINCSALGYLLKPVDPEELQSAVERVKEQLRLKSDTMLQVRELLKNIRSEGRQGKLAISTFSSVILVNYDDIIRLQSDVNYTTVYLKSGEKIVASRTLKDFAAMLEGKNFIRVHKSHLVNVDHIVRYHRGDGGSLEMSDSSTVEVSQRKKAELLSILNVM